MTWLARRAAASVVSGVTKGLPSRSPPIQFPKRSGTGVRSASPVAANSSSKARTSVSRARALACEQEVGDACLERKECPPCRLCWMRRQHRADVEARDRVENLIGRAACLAQSPHRPPRRRWLRLSARVAQILLTPSHAVHLLRRVDQQEEQR